MSAQSPQPSAPGGSADDYEAIRERVNAHQVAHASAPQPSSTGGAKYRTPTPWRKEGGCRIVGANHGIDGVSREVVAYEVICDQDADFIVLAVNSHDALVKALRDIDAKCDDAISAVNSRQLVYEFAQSSLAKSFKPIIAAALKAATGGN